MKVRYLIKYTKESEIKFISHLDLMRTIQRVIRRAALPIEYSKGFNPHMTISIAQPYQLEHTLEVNIWMLYLQKIWMKRKY